LHIAKPHTPYSIYLTLEPENNPIVFSNLVHHLGVSSTLGFYDIYSIYSIDSPNLLALIPRPAYAHIFIYPVAVYSRARKAENDAMKGYEGSGSAEPVIWFKQTIGNSCGLMGCLYTVSNRGAKAYIQSGSELEKILNEAVPLKMTQRAKVLYDSKAIEDAHASAAQEGDTAPHLGMKRMAFTSSPL